jgi:hypothetical protein
LGLEIPGHEAQRFFPLNKKQLSIPINKKENKMDAVINFFIDIIKHKDK